MKQPEHESTDHYAYWDEHVGYFRQVDSEFDDPWCGCPPKPLPSPRTYTSEDINHIKQLALARREALEEACLAVCLRCRGSDTKLEFRGEYWVHYTPMGYRNCEADPIRRLMK